MGIVSIYMDVLHIDIFSGEQKLLPDILDDIQGWYSQVKHYTVEVCLEASFVVISCYF